MATTSTPTTATAPLPSTSEFPSALSPVIHLPPSAQPTNVLLFLPGLGDSSTNFSSFARALNLPDTLCITLSLPFPLPAPLGLGAARSWSEDIQLDGSGDIDANSPLDRAAQLLAEEVIGPLLEKHGYTPSTLHLFGFGQGGSLALSVLLHPRLAGLALGSAVSIGGTLPLSPATSGSGSTIRTSNGTSATKSRTPLKRVRERFEFCEYERWRKGEDSMPKNREEVLPLMRFWGRRLRSRRGVPEGAVEVG